MAQINNKENKMGTKSMRLTMMRQAILPLVFAVMLRQLGRVNLIWCAFIFAELIVVPVSVKLWKKALKESKVI